MDLKEFNVVQEEGDSHERHAGKNRESILKRFKGFRIHDRAAMMATIAATALFACLIAFYVAMAQDGDLPSRDRSTYEARKERQLADEARKGRELANEAQKEEGLSADGVKSEEVTEEPEVTEEHVGASIASSDGSKETWNLGVGFYTAGIDIPAGRFDVIPTRGVGFIDTESNGANLRGPGHDDDEGYAESYKNFKLEEDETLEVKGVQVRIEYSSRTSQVKGRIFDESKARKFGAGNYIVGEDIDAGCYSIKCVSGCGFVASNREEGSCILSSNMDNDPETDDYFETVANARLVDGEEIQVTSGLTVQFVPEKK